MGGAGAILGGIGASKTVRAQNNATNLASAAAKWNPYDLTTGGGSVNFDGTNATSSLSAGNQGIYDQLQGLIGNNFGGNSASSGYQNFANAMGNQGLPQLFADYLNTSSQLPTGDYLNNQNMLGGLMNQSQMYGGMAGMGAMQNYGMANNALSGIPTDMSGLVNSNLNLLRQQAAPQEAQQLASTRDTLFGQGRLGAGDNTIGGANPEMQALYNSFGQNDIARQLASNQLGMQAQQQQANIGLGMANQYSNNGNNQMATLQNLLNMSGQFGNQQYSNALGMNDLSNTRAQQRMSSAQNLFGFGNQLGQQDFTNGITGLGATQNMDQSLQQLLALAGNLTSQQSQAGFNQGQFLMQSGKSASGAMLSGIGNGLMSMGGGMMGGSGGGVGPTGQSPYQGYQG